MSFFSWQLTGFGNKQSLQTLLLGSLVGSVLLSTLFFSRYFLLQAPDVAHLKDLYHHSQWAVPLSTRSISDDQLYLAAGVELVQGAHPFAVNPEVPPLGKYLYGAGYVVFGNPFVIAAFLYVGVVLLVYVLARSLGASQVRAGVAALAVSLSPAVSSQVSQTMLDLPLMFFLLLHVWLLSTLVGAEVGKVTTTNNARRFEVLKLIGAGVALGAFAAIKFPLFVPVVLVADAVFFWKVRRLRQGVVMLFVAGLTFLSTYSRYFLDGHSVWEWARSLYWTVQFYLAGADEHPFAQVVSAVLLGRFQAEAPQIVVLDSLEVTKNVPLQLTKVREWSLLWPIGFLTLGWVGARQTWMVFQKNSKIYMKSQLSSAQLLVVVLSVLYIALLVVVDFQARYFFPLIPVLAALCAAVLSFRSRGMQFLVGAVVVGLALQYAAFWYSPPTEIVKEITRTWNARNYADLYSFVLPSSVGVERDAFARVLATEIDQNLQVTEQEITVSIKPTGIMGTWGKTKLSGEVALTLKTPSFTLEKRVPVVFVNYNGQWLLQWDWEWYLAGFDPSCVVHTTLTPDSKGALIAQDGTVLSEYKPVEYLRLVTTGLVADDVTITALMPLTNNEYLLAQNFLLNTITGREWYDFPIRVSALSESQRAVFPERQQVWTKLERQKNTQLTEVQKKQVEALEGNYPELNAQAEVHIVLQCADGEKIVTISGERASVQLDEALR